MTGPPRALMLQVLVYTTHLLAGLLQAQQELTTNWTTSGDSCTHALNGACDEPYECATGTDATDCSQEGFVYGSNRYCQYTNDGECDESQYCPAGSDTHDCCLNGAPRETDPSGRPVGPDDVCCGGECVPPDLDWCQYANDGGCDEPQLGTGACPAGSDTTDCAGVEVVCPYTSDGECDEGRYCPAGTDTADCCLHGTPRVVDSINNTIVATEVDCSVSVDSARSDTPVPAGDNATAAGNLLPPNTNNTCQFADDGECDDPDIGSGACLPQTDWNDCSRMNSCPYAHDGECDEPSPYRSDGNCDRGTDSDDCCPSHAHETSHARCVCNANYHVDNTGLACQSDYSRHTTSLGACDDRCGESSEDVTAAAACHDSCFYQRNDWEVNLGLAYPACSGSIKALLVASIGYTNATGSIVLGDCHRSHQMCLASCQRLVSRLVSDCEHALEENTALQNYTVAIIPTSCDYKPMHDQLANNCVQSKDPVSWLVLAIVVCSLCLASSMAALIHSQRQNLRDKSYVWRSNRSSGALASHVHQRNVPS